MWLVVIIVGCKSSFFLLFFMLVLNFFWWWGFWLWKCFVSFECCRLGRVIGSVCDWYCYGGGWELFGYCVYWMCVMCWCCFFFDWLDNNVSLCFSLFYYIVIVVEFLWGSNLDFGFIFLEVWNRIYFGLLNFFILYFMRLVVIYICGSFKGFLWFF